MISLLTAAGGALALLTIGIARSQKGLQQQSNQTLMTAIDPSSAAIAVPLYVRSVHMNDTWHGLLPTKMVDTIEVTTASVIAKANARVSRVRMLLQDQRQQHIREISLDAEALSEEQIAANRHFKHACLLFASTATSLLIYPPLFLLHLPFIFYAELPFYKRAFQDAFQKRKVSTYVVDATIDIGSLLLAPVNPHILFIGIIAVVLRSFTFKVIAATKDGTRKSLTGLMGEQPQRVWIVRNGSEVEVPFAMVQRDDILVIEAGQIIPVDGVIEQGVGTIDQHMLTGEAQPVEKVAGDPVLAATIVLAGKLFIRVEKTGKETSAAQVGQMLLQTADYTSSIELRGEEISDQAALPTLLLSAATLPFLGPIAAMTMLITGFGYNMKLLGPLSVLNYLQLTALAGILIKDGRALEQIRNVDTVVFDKTGTLTLEQPHVGAIHPCAGYGVEAILTYAAAAEQRQTHPIARAILHAAAEQGVRLPTVSDASYQIGYGIQVSLAGKLLRVGSNRFMQMEGIVVPPPIEALAQEAQAQGHSLVYVAMDEQLAGAIELYPTVRPEAKRIVDALHRRGIELYIISGDNERPTRSLAAQLGIDHYFAETLPDHKAQLIRQLQDEGRFVCFVGDGINDSIALKTAQVSVSLRGATTIATDTAQIILMDETLNQLERLFTLADDFEANMQINLITTIVPGVVIIGGVLLGGIGYGSAMALFWAGGIAGVGNAMRPLLKASNQADLP